MILFSLKWEKNIVWFYIDDNINNVLQWLSMIEYGDVYFVVGPCIVEFCTGRRHSDYKIVFFYIIPLG